MLPFSMQRTLDRIFNPIAARSNDIALLGDTHSIVATTVCMESPYIRGVDVVFLGDGAEIADPREPNAIIAQFEELNKACIAQDVRLFCIRGNHSDPRFWRGGYDFSNLFFVPDYTTMTFPNGKRASLLGGAISIDRKTRVEGIDYWKDEVTPRCKILEPHDFLFAHDAPEEFNASTLSLCRSFPWFVEKDANLIEDCLRQRETISNVARSVGAKYLASGNFHQPEMAEKGGIFYRCVGAQEMILFSADKKP